MSTFQLFAATSKGSTTPFAAFRGIKEHDLASHFALAAGFPAFEVLFRVLDWWSTTGLAVYTSPDDAHRALRWIRERSKASGKSVPPLPWRVDETAAGKTTELCAWNLTTATPDSPWVGRPGPLVLARDDRHSTVFRDLCTLQAIAHGMGGSLVVIDKYATHEPGHNVLTALAQRSTPGTSPMISVGCDEGTFHTSFRQFPHLRFLTRNRAGNGGSEFHDRYVAVLARRHEATSRCEELVTALFLGHGLACAAQGAVKVASYGRIFGPPLEQLRSALAARYPLSSAA